MPVAAAAWASAEKGSPIMVPLELSSEKLDEVVLEKEVQLMHAEVMPLNTEAELRAATTVSEGVTKTLGVCPGNAPTWDSSREKLIEREKKNRG